MMNMRKIAFIAGIGWLSLTSAQAQQDSTLNRTVVVENQYNPIVMDASKINVLPKVEEPVAPKANIKYATSLQPVTDYNYQVMKPMVRDWEENLVYPGYLYAGYGNYGNVDTRLGYRWNISKKDRLNVEASLNGWNGDLKDLNGNDWTSRLYKSRIGLGYKHVFRKMDLTLGGTFHSQVFNYMNGLIFDSDVVPASVGASSRKQHQTMVHVYAGLASTSEDMGILFQGEIGMNYFKQKYPTNLEEGNEMNFYVKGNVYKRFNGKNVGMIFDFNNYSYSIAGMENAMSLELNPYYALGNDDWKISLGAHVDWWSGMDNEVNLSPAVSMEYVFSDSYVLYAKADGRRENRSFMELTSITPYWTLSHPYIVPTYVSLDAALGLKASPSDGWWFNVNAGYQIREDDLFWGLVDGGASYAGFIQEQSKVTYGNAALKHDYKDLFDLDICATYYHWDWEGNESLDEYGQKRVLALKPELELNAEIGYKPVKGLRVNVGYEYVKRCEDIYDPINNLYLGADYVFWKNLSVFGKVNNLLNKEYVRPDAYPAQKLNFLAGLSVQF